MDRGAATTTSSTTPETKRDALRRALGAEPLEGAGRLRNFLSYVVEEEIGGRGATIRGKTIAKDIYGRDLLNEGDPENVVRVDARRLRQILKVYYDTEGKSDPVHIHLDPGGYCPRFETVVPMNAREAKRVTAILVPLATFAAGAILGGILSVLVFNPREVDEAVATSRPTENPALALRREAIFEKSPASLQAVNLAHQGRSMIFPIFDLPRQELISAVFQRVIEIDPDYFGGHAGGAQVYATRAILTPAGARKDTLLASANQLARAAIRLNPSEGWTQSALAWVEFANGDYDRAYDISVRATKLDPNDGNVLDFHGAISLFSGHFEEAVKASDRKHLQGGSNQRFTNRNILAAASFHLGDMRKCVEAFREARQFGDPLAPPGIAYEAAALAALGRRQEALEKLGELSRAWPEARVDEMLYSIHKDRANADMVLDYLKALGWTSPSKRAVNE
jgi:tetratricopeptide (TPR) repeat protein